MIALLILVILVASARRGFQRGAPRELVDLLLVAIGFPVAFRLGPRVGELLYGSMVPLATRTLGAITVFALLTLAAAGLRRSLHRGQPELEYGERLAGAAVGTTRAVLVSVVALAVIAAAPTSSYLGQLAQRSRLVEVVTNPDGLTMTVFEAATGEDGMVALIKFNRAFPDGPIIADERRQIPAFDIEDIERLTAEGIEILDLVNADRTANGVAELTWSSALTAVGLEYAEEMYTGGFFAHVSSRTGDVGDRLLSHDISFTFAGENLALAPSVDEVHRGLMNSPGHRANILSRDFTHIGIGVVEGPIGLIVVQVFFHA